MQGEVIHKDILRHTPAGVPLLGLVLRHQSEQIEAGINRKVECEVSAVALGEMANRMQDFPLETTIRVTGFIARRSLKSTQLVLHINTIEGII